MHKDSSPLVLSLGIAANLSWTRNWSILLHLLAPSSQDYWSQATQYPCKGAIIGWHERFGVLIGVPECSASAMQIGGWGWRTEKPSETANFSPRWGCELPGDAMRRPRAPLQERARVTGQEEEI